MNGLIDYQTEKLSHISIERIRRDVAFAMSHDVMKWDEQKRIDFFYDLLLDIDNETVKCHWIDFVAPYVD
jgi:hypothetical protein